MTTAEVAEDDRKGLIIDLYNALIGPSKLCYEALREELIEKYGYNAFWDLQHEAFAFIGSNTRP
jgi:hypothetical protein